MKKVLYVAWWMSIISAHPPDEDLLIRGRKLCEQNQHAQALPFFEEAVRQKSNDVNRCFELAGIYIALGRVDQALDIYQTIEQYHPYIESVLYNAAYTLKMAGHLDESITYYKKVLTINPHNIDAHFGLAMAYVGCGDFKQAWIHHEHKLKQRELNSPQLRELLRTNSIAGKRILLRYEGGLGDTIMFIRYAKLMKDMGAYTVVAVQKPLIPLLANCTYIDELIMLGAHVKAGDASATLMSMPALCNTHIDTIPSVDAPYLEIPHERVEAWRQFFEQEQRFKIGICWGASVSNDISRHPVARRSIPLEKLVPLLQDPRVRCFSLQKYDGIDEIQELSDSSLLHVFDETFDTIYGGFIDTAAVMQHLDLIISVDTAIAHLAGALHRPVWLLLPYATDWRWMPHRTDSPWYPTMYIFKQPEPFNWERVIDQVRTKLDEILS